MTDDTTHFPSADAVVSVDHYPPTNEWANDHVVIAFANGYGASIVRGPHSYGGQDGLFEVAVLDREGNLTYDTPITDDVIGYLSREAVREVCAAIATLPDAPGARP